MPLKIVPASQPMTVSQLVMMVYGQPGVGKTSMGYTASKPLTLDFDGGAYRSAFRKDTVAVEDWSEIAQIDPAELEGFDTLVVDTGGRALDKLTAHIIRNNPKVSTPAGGLTLQGYGELKTTFAHWLKMVKECGLDVVILAHDAEDKQGDDIITRPDITGGSKQELIKVADAIGFLYNTRKGPVLDFNATDRWIAKNSGGFKPISVPSFSQKPDFLAEVIQQNKDALNRESEEQRKAAAEIKAWSDKIDKIEDADKLTALIPEVKQHPYAKTLRSVLWNRAKALGMEFDPHNGMFYKPDPENEDMPPDESEQAENPAAHQDAQ